MGFIWDFFERDTGIREGSAIIVFSTIKVVYVVSCGDYNFVVRGGELCCGIFGRRACRDDRGEDHVLD